MWYQKLKKTIYFLIIIFLFSCTKKSNDKEIEIPNKHIAKQSLKIKKKANYEKWIIDSGKRENIALKLQNFLKKDFCSALSNSKSFHKLKTFKTIKQNFDSKFFKYSSNKPISYANLNINPSKLKPKLEFISDLNHYFNDFTLFKVCDVHTHYFSENFSQYIIKINSMLLGLDKFGSNLEEHLYAELRFNKNFLLTDFIITKSNRVKSLKTVFKDVTLQKLKKYTFLEQGFPNPLFFGVPGNLDFGGINVVDVNQDGILDIYYSRTGPNLLFIGQSDGTYIEKAKEFGIADKGSGRAAVFADFDGDNDLDLILANMSLVTFENRHELKLYKRIGKSKFRNNNNISFSGKKYIGPYTSISVGDLDNDLDLDFIVGSYGDAQVNHRVEANNGGKNLLFINQGNLTFKEKSKENGFVGTYWTYASSFFDFDDDGDLDIYIANDYGSNNLYVNNGKGVFSEKSKKYKLDHPGAGMGLIWADFNNDLKTDLYVSNMFSNAGSRIVPFAKNLSKSIQNKLWVSAQGNALYINKGNFNFIEKTDQYGLHDGGWSWGAVNFDYDNDGDEDIYQLNGYITGKLKDDL